MSQFNAPIRRAGGGLDVYTGLLAVAVLVLGAGIAAVAINNVSHSKAGNSAGGFMTMLEPSDL